MRATARVIRALVLSADPPKQKTVWKKAKVDSGHFSRVHSGEEIPKEETVTKIAKAYPAIAEELLRAWSEDCVAELQASIARVFHALGVDAIPKNGPDVVGAVGRAAERAYAAITARSDKHAIEFLSAIDQLEYVVKRGDLGPVTAFHDNVYGATRRLETEAKSDRKLGGSTDNSSSVVA